MQIPFLDTLGLTKNEADLYELLLQLGEVPANQILSHVKLPRATAYKTLYSLQKKGLVTSQDIHKKIHFRPEPPQNLFNLAEGKYKELGRAQNALQSILPQLTSQYTLSVERPVVRIYEGVEGIKQAHLELLGEKKEICAYVYINEEIDKKLNQFWKKYYTIRKRDNIFARVISPDSKDARNYKETDAQQLRETRLVPLDTFPIRIEKDITGNKVGFFSSEKGNLISTIIDNKEIADAERAIFELTWKQVALT